MNGGLSRLLRFASLTVTAAACIVAWREHERANRIAAELTALQSQVVDVQPAPRLLPTPATPDLPPLSEMVPTPEPPQTVVQSAIGDVTPARVVPMDTPQVAGTEPVYVSPGLPGQEIPPPPTDEERAARRKAWLAEFDRHMDLEFGRLETREGQTTNELELATIGQIKEKLLALDKHWAETADAADLRDKVQAEIKARELMGEIITLSRTDRNQRLSDMAGGLGITDPIQVEWFINQLDTILAETHLDWAALFNNAP